MIMEYVHYCNILVLISQVHDQRIFCTWRHHKNDSCQPKFIKKGHVNKIFNAHEIKTEWCEMYRHSWQTIMIHDVLKIKVEYRFLDQVFRYEYITCVWN